MADRPCNGSGLSAGGSGGGRVGRRVAAARPSPYVALGLGAVTVQTDNRLLDDLARLAGGAFDAAAAMAATLEVAAKRQAEGVVSRLDLVTREEFEALRVLAGRAREAGEDLSIRLAALDARLAAVEARLDGYDPGRPADAGVPPSSDRL